jgi:hypothetical protein
MNKKIKNVTRKHRKKRARAKAKLKEAREIRNKAVKE